MLVTFKVKAKHRCNWLIFWFGHSNVVGCVVQCTKEKGSDRQCICTQQASSQQQESASDWGEDAPFYHHRNEVPL